MAVLGTNHKSVEGIEDETRGYRESTTIVVSDMGRLQLSALSWRADV